MTLYERLAAIEHERWSDWQRHLHGGCVRQPDGSLVIPADRVARWERLISTPYAELTEREKASDREQVDRYWSLIQEPQCVTDPIDRAARTGELAGRLREVYGLDPAPAHLAAHLMVAHGWTEDAAASLSTEERRQCHDRLAHAGDHHH